MMPYHTRYVEVFGGSLAVLYAKPSRLDLVVNRKSRQDSFQKSKDYTEVVNDINSDIINLHRVIKTRPHALSFELDQLLKSRQIFNDIQNNILIPANNIQKAAFYFFLLKTSFSSMGKHFPATGGTHKSIYRDFTVISKRLKHVTIENLDFRKCIRLHDHKEVLFYLDPPYMGAESFYKNEHLDFHMKDHIALSDILKTIKGKFILSYNNHEFIRNLYKDFNLTLIDTKYILGLQKSNKATTKELLITNY